MLILGTRHDGYALAEAIRTHAAGPLILIGVVEEAPGAARADSDVMCLGDMSELDEIIDEVQPARIALALRHVRHVGAPPDHLLLEARMRGVVVEEATTIYERLTGKMAIESLKPRSLFLSEGFRHSDFDGGSDVSRAVTRCVNLLIASVGVIALAPLGALIALAIRLDSPGSPFFVQARTGRDGKPFGLIKFRTMRQAEVHPSEWAKDNDYRITRVGRVLRKFRLDELPQLLNIIHGEMNLVGPRPIPASIYKTLLEHVPYYRLRAMVRPGLTGWAQVRYRYANSIEEEAEKMRYDLYYIKHRSLWFDLRILAATIAVVVHGRVDGVKARGSVTEWVEAWPGVPSGVNLR